MATITVPLLVAVVGLILYFAPVNAKVSEAGKWAFIVGLFWTLARASGSVHF